MPVNPIPQGYSTVTSFLILKDVPEFIEFAKKSFDAIELERHYDTDKVSVMHAEIKIGDSCMMLNDEIPQMKCLSPQTIGGTSGGIFLYVQDTDDVYNKAISAGAKSKMPPMDAFWGDRFASIIDPFGHVWSIATHQKDMTLDEVKKAGDEFMKNQCK